MQHPQPDEAAWQACAVRRRAMTSLWVGIFTGWLRFMHQRHGHLPNSVARPARTRGLCLTAKRLDAKYSSIILNNRPMANDDHREFKNHLYGQFARVGKALGSPY